MSNYEFVPPKVTSLIDSISKSASDEFNYKSQAEYGVHFLTDTNPAPTGSYTGFVVLFESVVGSITYTDPTKYSGDISTVTAFYQGYYPLQFTTITLVSGEMMLIKGE